jgi:hypothetical protein
MNYMYKKGDLVRVWSLQSFFEGGFIEGREGIVSQDQSNSSVIVAVPRLINGIMKIDPSYEVYAKQLELVKPQPGLVGEFEQLIRKIKAS